MFAGALSWLLIDVGWFNTLNFAAKGNVDVPCLGCCLGPCWCPRGEQSRPHPLLAAVLRRATLSFLGSKTVLALVEWVHVNLPSKPWEEESWTCLSHGWASQDSAGELALVVWLCQSWWADQPATTQAEIKGFELVHTNTYPIYELRNGLKGPVLQIQGLFVFAFCFLWRWGGSFKSRGQIWRGREMSVIRCILWNSQWINKKLIKKVIWAENQWARQQRECLLGFYFGSYLNSCPAFPPW